MGLSGDESSNSGTGSSTGVVTSVVTSCGVGLAVVRTIGIG